MPADTVRLVDPAAEVETKHEALAPRLASLKGKRVALIDNTKHNVEPYLDATRKLLEQRYGVAGVEYYRKYSASVPTPPEVLDRLAQSCDALVHGIAD